MLKVGNKNMTDATETRLMKAETVQIRRKRGESCFLSGTSAFCRGECPSKVYVTKATNRCGDGKYCKTGTKKYCWPKKILHINKKCVCYYCPIFIHILISIFNLKNNFKYFKSLKSFPSKRTVPYHI